MTAKQDKTGNIPAHDKYTHRDSHNGGAQCIYFSEVFRCQVQGVHTKCFHKSATHSTK